MTEKKGWKLAGRAVLMAVISLALGLSVYRWNAKNLVGDLLPMPFGWGGAVVLTGSMEPALSAGDLLIVRDTGEYAPEDIVVYQTQGQLVVHRIQQVQGQTLVTQGDANNTPDPPIVLEQVKGEVVLALPGLGAVADAIRSPVGVIVILAAAGLLLRLSYRKEKQADDRELEVLKEQIRQLKEEQ